MGIAMPPLIEPVAALEAIRSACKNSEVLFPLAGGHTLILDEILTMHGSKPFRGERCVLVAMAWS
jgi:hypothetical protein